MSGILALPAWFNPWGWTAIAIVAIIILIVIIVLIARSGKKDKRAAKSEESVREERAKEPAAVKEEPKPAPKAEEKPKTAAKSEPKPAQKAAAKPAQKTAAKPATKSAPKAKPVQKTESAPKTTKAAAAKPAAAEPVKTYHIAKRKEDGRWQVKAAGASKAIKLFLTQQDAIDFAKKTAENQDARIVIHKEDGTFRRLSYTKK
ncbi:MAG: DUF2188 domain-containing protein [Clostridia bacterium]|nr:DUF2188 domain-containing protein [Clostridia bacterium]